MGRDPGCARQHAAGLRPPRAIVPIIAVAEVSSWTAVLTTCFLFNATENSLWGFTVALVAVALVRLRARGADAAPRRFLAFGIAACIAFVAFLASVDVPMYVARWRADEAAGKPYLSLADGLADVTSRRVVTGRFEDWREEMAWMAGYFSAAVWLSIGLAHAPRWAPRRASHDLHGGALGWFAGQHNR